MNIPLLRRVQKRILKEPEHFRMDSYFQVTNNCGTTGCIGGWSIVLGKRKNINKEALKYQPHNFNASTDAMKILELEHVQSNRLFHLSFWPIKFCLAYIRAGSDIEKAKITSDRIDHFIATEGRE